jgi:hypothetical protein
MDVSLINQLRRSPSRRNPACREHCALPRAIVRRYSRADFDYVTGKPDISTTKSPQVSL